MDFKNLILDPVGCMDENDLYGLADAFGVDYVGERLSLDEIRAVLRRLLSE